MSKQVISFSIRVPEDVHAKLRVMSAFRNESLNTVINEALCDSVLHWEKKYGPLPKPPEGLALSSN